ncbi:MAG TPA: IS1595 family transposase [Verrucomicrobiae bacterium]|nr:IS1595 family transposase [Verrucomicrobiae bacterium]
MRVKQSIPKELRYTVRNFDREFPNDDACLEYMKEQRWPGGIAYCEKCDRKTKHHRIVGRTAYSCDYCGTQIYPLAGTIFEKTTTSLKLWFYAAYLMGSTRCGISAKQIQRETGVTYKTAWRMFKQIRTLLSEGDMHLEGPTVEVDETYFGGKRKYGTGRPGRGDLKMTPIVGIVQRGGKVLARAIPAADKTNLLGTIREHVTPGSLIYTDEYPAYHGIKYLWRDGKPAGYRHRQIRHKRRVYVNGDIHTNSVEGFWSLIKRGIGGVYQSVSPKYLQTYLDEYSFRFNRRREGNQQFRAILERAVDRAL